MKPQQQKILTKLAKEQKVELGLVENIEKEYNKIKKESDSLFQTLRRAAQDVDEVSQKASALIKRVNSTDADVDKLKQAADDLGIGLPNEAEVSVRQLQAYKNDLKKLESRAAKASDDLFAIMG